MEEDLLPSEEESDCRLEVRQLDLTELPNCDMPRPLIGCTWPTDPSSTQFEITVSDGWRIWHHCGDMQKLGGATLGIEEKIRRSRAALAVRDPNVTYKLTVDHGVLELYWALERRANFKIKLEPVVDTAGARLEMMRALVRDRSRYNSECTVLRERQRRLRGQAAEARRLNTIANCHEPLLSQMVETLNEVKQNVCSPGAESDSGSASGGSRASYRERQLDSSSQSAARSISAAPAEQPASHGVKAAGVIKPRKPRGTKRERVAPAHNRATANKRQAGGVAPQATSGSRQACNSSTGLTKQMDLADLE